ncbi:hypothetical protein IKJ53_03050 [bacterium]|nr:hypothetical protein [bacterium]
MTRINGYNGDVPPRGSSKGAAGSTDGSSYASSFDEYKAKQQAEFNQYKAQQENDYETFVRQKQEEFNAFTEKSAGDAQGAKPADASKANAEYAAALSNPDNWKEVQAQPAQQPLVTNETAPSAQKSTGDAPKLTDYISGLSKETVEYLNNSEQFKGFEKEYTTLLAFQFENKQKLPSKKEALLAAKEKFENTSYSDFEAKSAAQEEYFKAQKEYDTILGNIYGAEKESSELMKNIISYASTINNWKDGVVIVGNRHSVGTGQPDVYNREYTCVTLRDGQKAYAAEGKLYQLEADGSPSFDKLIE